MNFLGISASFSCFSFVSGDFRSLSMHFILVLFFSFVDYHGSTSRTRHYWILMRSQKKIIIIINKKKRERKRNECRSRREMERECDVQPSRVTGATAALAASIDSMTFASFPFPSFFFLFDFIRSPPPSKKKNKDQIIKRHPNPASRRPFPINRVSPGFYRVLPAFTGSILW